MSVSDYFSPGAKENKNYVKDLPFKFIGFLKEKDIKTIILKIFLLQDVTFFFKKGS